MAATAGQFAEAVRASDRDRYLCALYAPPEKRGDVLALYAFNAEIASIRDRIHEALPGEIRLQWWRDALDKPENTGEGHPLAAALLQAIRTHDLPLSAFHNYLDARIFDLYNDPMPGRGDLEGYCGETASAIIQLSALILDSANAPRFAEAAGHAGCAQAITGLLRLMPLHRARGQCYIPGEILAAAGLAVDEFLASGAGEDHAARGAVMAMIALANEHVAAFRARASEIPETLRPAFLPVAPVPAYLARLLRDPVAALTETVDIPQWKRHWILFRTAARGWR